MRYGHRLGLAMLLALGAATPSLAAPEQLKGTRFIDVMSNNTVSGTTAAGAAYNLYFVDGGGVTYEDSAGERARGRWLIDPDGDVCITWEGQSEQLASRRSSTATGCRGRARAAAARRPSEAASAWAF